MNVEKGKNAVIVFLTALNIILYVLFAVKNSAYTLSAAQDKAIAQLLSQNKIALYTPILRDFSPKRSLGMMPFDYTVVENLLFGGDADDARVNEEFDHTVKTYNDKTIIYSKGELIFSRDDAFSGEPENSQITRTDAVNISRQFLNELSVYNLEFILEASYYDDYAYTLTYRGVFRDSIIHTNYAHFYIDTRGILLLTCSFSVPTAFTGPALEIYSADEALYSLMKGLHEKYGNTALRITKMDMVYYREPIASDNSPAVPCYRVFVRSDNSNEKDVPYLINAYANTFLR